MSINSYVEIVKISFSYSDMLKVDRARNTLCSCIKRLVELQKPMKEKKIEQENRTRNKKH